MSSNQPKESRKRKRKVDTLQGAKGAKGTASDPIQVSEELTILARIIELLDPIDDISRSRILVYVRQYYDSKG